jgi:phosphatidylethanolamine/phosphatidyl-N-methylethanolamine N-methyltransferase
MDIEAVKSSYARWAPIYDRTFGRATSNGRKRAVEYINKHPGRVLEVGVGTGLALPLYSAAQRVTAIDFSEEMLDKARNKVKAQKLDHVVELRQMDARQLDFPDGHFDWVVAMHVLSVVPEPERVMAEIARVCKPGGKVVITNHFTNERGISGWMERITAPLASLLGWHPDFKVGTVLQESVLLVKEKRQIPPFRMMTFLVLEKAGEV